MQQTTLRRLLDHLKLVASYQEVNKMTCQNLAVCFGPVLLSQRQEASCHTNRVFIDSEELASALHFKKHIEVLHYLLQLWPGEWRVSGGPLSAASSQVMLVGGALKGHAGSAPAEARGWPLKTGLPICRPSGDERFIDTQSNF